MYAREPAKVYDVLWDLAGTSFVVLEALAARLRPTGRLPSEGVTGWTDQVHRRLIEAIRDAYEAPRDVFPLVEVSVVAFERQRTTQAACDLADRLALRHG